MEAIIMLHQITDSWKAATKSPTPNLGNLSHISLLHRAQLHSNDKLCLGWHVLKDLRSMCGPSKSCSFLIWSSLDMSANSSRKPSKLLTARRRQGNRQIVKSFTLDLKLCFPLQINLLPATLHPLSFLSAEHP
jgi:hypothetical protein